MAKRTRVMPTKTMRRVEAVFCIPLVTAFTAAAMVGMGLKVVQMYSRSVHVYSIFVISGPYNLHSKVILMLDQNMKV